MSSPKFASITSSLLARKGEAQPWSHTGVHPGVHPSLQPAVRAGLHTGAPTTSLNAGVHSGARAAVRGSDNATMSDPPEKFDLPWRPYEPDAAVEPPAAKERTCSIRISAHDYERLGILAVKCDSTRQQLLKDALAQFLDARARDFGCACLNMGGCGNDCGHQP